MKRIIICTGGHLGDWALPVLTNYDYLIGADGGAYFLAKHGFRPDTSLGDFDSITPKQLERVKAASGTMTACDPVDKDYTDTELAFRHALKRSPGEIVLVGALGSRFDHSLANVHLLKTAMEHGVKASIVDRHNRISLTADRLELRRSEYTHVSLLPLTGTVKGINLRGFRYPLRDAELRIGQSLGISNVLAEDNGLIEIGEGLLLVIESRD